MPVEYFNPVPHLSGYARFEDLLSKPDKVEIDDLCAKVRQLWTSEPLTPIQRIMGAMMGQDIDRVPCVISKPEFLGMKKLGVDYVRKYADPVAAVKVALVSILECKTDSGCEYLPIDMNLSDVFGTKWEFLPHTLPKVTEWAVKRGFEDILENPLPDPRQSQALKWQIETARFLNERLGDLSPFATVFALGPYYTYNACLRGPVDGFRDIKRHPDLAVEAFDKLCTFIVDLLRYLMEAYHSPAWMLIESLASPSFTSPAWFERYCAPYNKRILQELAPAPGTISGGGQGQTDFTPLLQTYADMGYGAFSFGPPTDLRKMKAISDEKGTFIFHWAMPAPLLAYGTPEQIEEQVRETLRIGAPGKRYVLSTDLPDDETPLANLLAVRDACLKYGRYPLQFADAGA